LLGVGHRPTWRQGIAAVPGVIAYAHKDKIYIIKIIIII